jgi:hypothetical protein
MISSHQIKVIFKHGEKICNHRKKITIKHPHEHISHRDKSLVEIKSTMKKKDGPGGATHRCSIIRCMAPPGPSTRLLPRWGNAFIIRKGLAFKIRQASS